ncbi:probable arginine--tRNA ligase, mitochondrial [Sinocyclocheilus grahami]|uniref:probable arginine--tRNA ligase, mitochondrial n=1 Tax=Sinocyclocheilus grahami TaxID=75366 RepID=UPI0007AD3449|nr:PREDICTED: probable arginine--tRNA ligase, mitochondrial [Sinocyclocheilus grahami]
MKRDAVVEEVSAGRGVILFRLNKLILAQLAEVCGVSEDVFIPLISAVPVSKKHFAYSSPNIAKKFHAGHLRSTIIGNFIANLKKALGKEVIRVNYLGDWGMQFGLLGAGFERFGSQEKLRTQPLEHLFEVYVQVNREAERDESVRSAAAEFFRRLERSEDQALALWRQFREITVDEYKRIYQRLGVHFDHYSGEAFHHHQTQSVLDVLMSQGLLKTTEYDTTSHSDSNKTWRHLNSRKPFLHTKNTQLCPPSLFKTDKSQTVHFQQLFHILQTMGTQTRACVHVAFGLVQGMSTRRGEVVFLEDVLEEARSRMLNNMRQSSTSKELEDPEQTAERVGISALIIQDFRGPLMSDYKFDWDKVLQAHGDTGVFLQYTHARLCSLLRRHASEMHSCCDVSPLVDSRSVSVLQHLLRTSVLTRFSCVFSHLAASAHRELPVKGSSAAVAQARLCLFSAVRSVLANGMRILGITPVEKM